MSHTLMYRAKTLHDVLLQWLKQNQKELETGNYTKINLEIIISTRTRNPVKFRSLITHESDLTERVSESAIAVSIPPRGRREGVPG